MIRNPVNFIFLIFKNQKIAAPLLPVKNVNLKKMTLCQPEWWCFIQYVIRFIYQHFPLLKKPDAGGWELVATIGSRGGDIIGTKWTVHSFVFAEQPPPSHTHHRVPRQHNPLCCHPTGNGFTTRPPGRPHAVARTHCRPRGPAAGCPIRQAVSFCAPHHLPLSFHHSESSRNTTRFYFLAAFALGAFVPEYYEQAQQCADARYARRPNSLATRARTAVDWLG